jgi:hypothetical protein
MIYTSLAVLALSASAALSPGARLVHFHPHAAQLDNRITLTLRNGAPVFQDVKIDGRSYTIGAHQGITVKAPAGTVIYADSATGSLRRGATIAQLSAKIDHQLLDIK